MKLVRVKKLIPLTVAAVIAAMSAGFSALASDTWTKGNIDLSISKISVAQTQTTSLTGLYYDSAEDDSIADDTLYVPMDTFFGTEGIAGKLGIQWVVRDGNIYSSKNPTGIGIVNYDGKSYIPALDTMRNLDIAGVLVNNDHIMVSVW